MAVDPVTVKILAQIALKAATDKETRRKILIFILAPVMGLLLLIAFIIYLITSPLSLLIGWLLPNEIGAIEDFQKEYGYNQSAFMKTTTPKVVALTTAILSLRTA